MGGAAVLALLGGLLACSGDEPSSGDPNSGSNPNAPGTPSPGGEQTPAPPAAPASNVTFTPPGGTFESSVTVQLTTDIEAAEIRFTTDGTLPTADSPVYDGTPITLTETGQVRARAYRGTVAAGLGGSAVYVARTFDATSDLPLVIVDGYGGGKPTNKNVYRDAAFLTFEPIAGVASLASAPSLATRAGYRVRGQSSASFDKTPYKVELWDEADQDIDLPVLGMPAESDWALVGPFTDRALIRHSLIYDLGRDMGLWAPKYRFAEVYINYDGGALEPSDYEGVYLVIETIKSARNRFNLKKLRETDSTEPAISGGYIFKFDWAAAEEPTLACTGSSPIPTRFGGPAGSCPSESAGQFPTAMCGGGGGFGGGGFGGGGFGGGMTSSGTCWTDLEVVEPKLPTPAQQEWLTRYISDFHATLRPTPLGDYATYIDVASFVDTFILNEFSRNLDAYTRSFYFHKEREGKLVAGPLWDFNLIMGAGASFCNDNPQGWQYEQRIGGNDWMHRLATDPAFMAEVATRWKSLRQGVLAPSALETRIDAYQAELRQAAARDFERWPLCEVNRGLFRPPAGTTFEAQLQVVRDFMRLRAEWLDGQLP